MKNSNMKNVGMRIKITKNGPYHVTGAVPIREMMIKPMGHHHILAEGRALPQADEYYLCRCGGSQKAPFCDGNHIHSGFNGAETASREPYIRRVVGVTQGATMNLLDDNRCAFARFCHTELGDVWSMTEHDYDPRFREAAIQAVNECPSGRLVLIDKDGDQPEEIHEPEILIVQDPEQDSSAGIFVRGPITIEAADGEEYEVRNRVALCRCGRSQNKPFCDAMHIRFSYNDGHL